ncbi:YjgN family protein [Deinococcus sedimenti]|uniref:YjgN family protein n=1 Tax=Deinococcus sedimenti TaxID=1867090 RepID=UPI0016670748|nr:YjgN family protein [Deinococcus sedimenti]
MSEPTTPESRPLGRHDPTGTRPTSAALADGPPAPMGGPADPPDVMRHDLSFTGSAGEYFRLWIVNVALTLVTLGIYLPWARVRTRQYFYGHTWLDGQNFEYRANPAALLRGYLLVGALFLLYGYSLDRELYWLMIPILLLYAGAYPWLVWRSLRFQAANTFHRGLNFSFHGTAGESYVAYGAANLAASVAGIFALPWAWFMQRQYQVRGLGYGQARGHFRGDVAPFYLIGLTSLGLSVGGVIVALLLGGMVAGAWSALSGELTSGRGEIWDRVSPTTLWIFAGVAYVSFLLLYVVGWQYVRGATMKYVLNNAELGGVVRSGATFNPWGLVWISVTNSLAQVLTLGLATPWAAIRRARFVLLGTHIRAITDLDHFRGQAQLPGTALGEAASELLDIQVGF